MLLAEMTGSKDADPNAVLAFLVGSIPSLGAAPNSSSMAANTDATRVMLARSETEDEAPELSSDSDKEQKITAAAAAKRTNNRRIITSYEYETVQDQQISSNEAPLMSIESEKEVTVEQGAGETCKEDPGSTHSTMVQDGKVAEAEHEDDCTIVALDSNDMMTQEVASQQESARRQGSELVVEKTKAIKAYRALTGSRAHVNVVASTATTNSILETKTQLNMPTREDVLFVGGVVSILVVYLLACMYSSLHPVVVPLPDYKQFFSAHDISNVSVHIVSPVENSLVTPQGIMFEWKLANFPVEALHLYGAEVFRYQVSLDDEVVTSEIGFLALGEEGEDERKNSEVNRTVRFPIPLRKFSFEDKVQEQFKLHLEVTIPIPGLIGEAKMYKRDVHVHKPVALSPENEMQLTLTSPLDDETFGHGESIVLEYTAVNVQEMEVLIDGSIFFKKTHVNDGNVLLRKLGIGSHKFEIRATNEQGEVVTSSQVRVKII